jgi:hypothetical protein
MNALMPTGGLADINLYLASQKRAAQDFYIPARHCFKAYLQLEIHTQFNKGGGAPKRRRPPGISRHCCNRKNCCATPVSGTMT